MADASDAAAGLTAAPARADLAPLVEAAREAAARGRRLQPRGAGRWWPELGPGAAPLCGAPDTLLRFDPADLVATAGAAMPMDALHAALAAQGVMVALDAPGDPGRTLGGVLASGGGGPLAASLGPARDQVLGLTFVAGNGAVVKSGGRVVKNVAGFDLAKVLIGGFGGFGCIADVHLRLRARPPAERTAAWSGSLADVSAAAARILAAGAAPLALEVVDPALARALGLPDAWAILIRTSGTEAAAAEEMDACLAAAGAGARTEPPAGVWRGWGPAVAQANVVLRIGADPAAWSDAVQLAETCTGAAQLISVTVPRGTVRIGLAAAGARGIAALREATARRGWPVTLERAGAALRQDAGVWGALPGRTERLIAELRSAFDPGGVFAAPLWTP